MKLVYQELLDGYGTCHAAVDRMEIHYQAALMKYLEGKLLKITWMLA